MTEQNEVPVNVETGVVFCELPHDLSVCVRYIYRIRFWAVTAAILNLIRMNGPSDWVPMNSDSVWSSSFHGFVDYSVCFPQTAIVWMVIGLGITAGTVISLFPQWRLIVLQRSSFGLSTFTIFVTSFGQFIYIVNIMCLHSAEFIGTL
jgi:hypothetical protein